MKSPTVWIYTAAGISVGFLAVVMFLFLGTERSGPPPTPELPPEAFVDPKGIPEPLGDEAEADDPLPPSRRHEREVVLFFQSADKDRLFPEIRTILRTASVADQARQVVVELINGSQEGNLPVIPVNTRLRELYLTGTGILCVDFSQEIVEDHSGGSADELATVYSIVNSLTVNFPEFRNVRILVEGEERQTLKYHVDLTRTYQQDLSLVEEMFL
ncbi:MAG: GerMN domain-containing protein [Acidobacteriota bacterium]